MDTAGRPPLADAVERLTSRERQVLALMAEGRSNPAIARSLHVTDKAIEKHVGNIFLKLDLMPAEADHRRVLAVLCWIDRSGSSSSAGVVATVRPRSTVELADVGS